MQFGGIPLLLALLLPAQAEDPAPPPPAPAQEGTGKAAPARPKAPDGPAAAEARGDRIHLLDGRIITGEVVDEGTQIRVIKRLGSVLILKRDVIKVEIEDEVVVVHPTLDRVILHSGQEIIGKVRIEKDGELVVVVGELGEISHPRSEVYDIILANPEAKGRVRDRGAVQKRIAAQIASLDDEEKAEEARNGIIAEGIFAIAQLEAALPDATGRRREEIERILRTNRLRTVLTREIEIGVPAVYERLLGPEPGARLEALQEIVLYHKDDAGRILAHMMGEGEADPVIRGYIVDQMGKLRRTTDLMDLLQTADPQVQLASAIALGENGILLGVFRFLLEREPASAILASFDLEDVNRYFPEFEEEIRRRVGWAGPS